MSETDAVSRVDRTQEGAVAVLTVNNVKRRNALSPEIRAELVGHLNDIED